MLETSVPTTVSPRGCITRAKDEGADPEIVHTLKTVSGKEKKWEVRAESMNWEMDTLWFTGKFANVSGSFRAGPSNQTCSAGRLHSGQAFLGPMTPLWTESIITEVTAVINTV